jgi:hypothetical protein
MATFTRNQGLKGATADAKELTVTPAKYAWAGLSWTGGVMSGVADQFRQFRAENPDALANKSFKQIGREFHTMGYLVSGIDNHHPVPPLKRD